VPADYELRRRLGCRIKNSWSGVISNTAKGAFFHRSTRGSRGPADVERLGQAHAIDLAQSRFLLRRDGVHHEEHGDEAEKNREAITHEPTP
jgi:hypothetical protein